MTGLPRDPRYRRYWGYYNRPRPGCGCLYTLLLAFLLYWMFSFLWTPLAFWF